MPKLSCKTFARGARQLVVQDAFDTTGIDGSYDSWFTPITKMGHSSFGGAEIITFLAPPSMCALAADALVNTPVLSQMYSAPASPQGMSAGFFL